MLKRDTGRAGSSALELLHAAVTALAATSSLPEAASSFLRQVCPRTAARRGAVWAFDADEVGARCVASWHHGAAPSAASGVVVRSSWEATDPTSGGSEAPGDTVPVRTLLATEGTPTRLLAAHAAGMTGSAVLPLRFAGPTIGALELWRAGSPLDLETRRAIETAAVCLSSWISHDQAARSSVAAAT